MFRKLSSIGLVSAPVSANSFASNLFTTSGALRFQSSTMLKADKEKIEEIFAAEKAPPGKVRVTFVEANNGGKEHKLVVPVGSTLMEAGRDNRIDIEAACDGTCACSTCHVFLDEKSFDALPQPDEDEMDMLDLAPILKPTSRLSCQVQLTSEVDKVVATLPEEQTNQLL